MSNYEEPILSPIVIWEQLNELEDIVKEIITMKNSNVNTNQLMKKIIEMEDYISSIFLTEEEQMVRYSLPWMDIHKKQHNYIRAKVEEINLYNVSMPEEYFSEAMDFLLELIASHMLKEDVQIAKYINQSLILAQE